MRRLKLVLLAFAVAALASFGIAACGDDDEGDGGGGGEDVSDASFDLTVGALVPLTGDLSQFGPPGQKAAELAIEEASAALEEAGADITVTMETADTQTEPQAAQTAAQQLVSNGATCLVGPWASGETVPVGRSVAARSEVPLISPSATSPEITDLPDNGFVFRTAPSDALQGQVLADVVEQELGSADATVSLAARNDPYGEGIVNEFKAAWEAKGGTTTGPVLYDPELSSYNSEANQIVEGDPDQFVIIDFEEPYNRLGAALARTGSFDPHNLWTADGLAFEDGVPKSIPNDALAGAKGTRPSSPEDTDTAKAFDDLYKQAPGAKSRGTFDAQNFDAATLCVLAAVAAGSNEGPAIAEKIQEVASPPGTKYDFTQLADAIKALQAGEDIDFEGASGPLDLDDNGDPVVAFYERYEYDDQGKFSIVETVEKQAE
jgi:ABC-type branched-chain amino acid transport systems, periplasmic component